MVSQEQEVIDQTKKWITQVVIACNFCPFAANALKQQTVHYQVEESSQVNACLDSLLQEAERLDSNELIETSFLIFSQAFPNFDDYLDVVFLAENLLIEKGYEGIYQLASFHPAYLFHGSLENDPANYTNRSIYPMLHLLRESSIDRVLLHYNHPEKIPDTNIQFSKNKGLAYMKLLRDTCF